MSSPTPYMPPLSLICDERGKSPKTPIGRGIVSLLKSSQMEGANFRALVKCLMKEVSSSAAAFRAAY